jgi:hypothetical protein
LISGINRDLNFNDEISQWEENVNPRVNVELKIVRLRRVMETGIRKNR